MREGMIKLVPSAFAFALATIGASSASGGPFGSQVTENFETNTDLYWEGLNHRTAPQNYGWSNNTDKTQNSLGEMGGTFWRDESPANFYGFNIGTFDPSTDDFAVSGLLRTSAGTAATVFLGYFAGASSYSSGGQPKHFLGVQLDDGVTAYVHAKDASFGDRNGPVLAPSLSSTVTYPFSLTYDAEGNSGRGTLTLDITGRGSHTLLLSLGRQDAISDLTHFGVFPGSADGGPCSTFFDDLTFSSENQIPEPASLAIVCLGGLLAVRRRRRGCR
jgi:hypothetical protein